MTGTRACRNGDEDGTEERSAARSFVSFSLERGVDEPWSLPLNSISRDIMIGLNPEGRLGDEGGELGERGKRRHGQRQGEKRCAVFRLLVF